MNIYIYIYIYVYIYIYPEIIRTALTWDDRQKEQKVMLRPCGSLPSGGVLFYGPLMTIAPWAELKNTKGTAVTRCTCWYARGGCTCGTLPFVAANFFRSRASLFSTELFIIYSFIHHGYTQHL